MIWFIDYVTSNWNSTYDRYDVFYQSGRKKSYYRSEFGKLPKKVQEFLDGHTPHRFLCGNGEWADRYE